MAAISSDIKWDSGKYVFFNRAHTRIECEPTMKNVAKKLVREYGFDAEKVEQHLTNLISWLGKTGGGEIDRKKAEHRFQKLVKHGAVTIERVGFRKDDKGGTSKFYLMINKPLNRGANNEFHVAFSRKGTLRAVLRDLGGSLGGSPALARELSEKEFIPECFSRRSLRIMNEDPNRGITVLELGGENLRHFPIAHFSREKRWQLHLSIFQGLNQIHKLGVHLDVKPENIVVDEEGCAKFIDFDTMSRHGRAIGKKENGQISPTIKGTIAYHSPKQLAAFVTNKPTVADKRDDIWAAMLTICELELKVPKDGRMLSPELIKRFKQYNAFRFEMVKKFTKESCRDSELFDAHFVDGPWSRNLFQGLSQRLDEWPYSQLADAVLESQQYPLDPIVYAMALTRSPDRVDAQTVLCTFADPEIQSRIPKASPSLLDFLFGLKN